MVPSIWCLRRGSKRSHTGGECVACSGLTNSREGQLLHQPKFGLFGGNHPRPEITWNYHGGNYYLLAKHLRNQLSCLQCGNQANSTLAIVRVIILNSRQIVYLIYNLDYIEHFTDITFQKQTLWADCMQAGVQYTFGVTLCNISFYYYDKFRV